MTSQQKGIGAGVVIILALIVISWYGYKNWGWFGGTKKEGSACKDTNGNPSVIVNGVCKEVIIPNNPSNLTTI